MSAIDVDTVLGWRGRTVVSTEGEELGTLQDVFLDEGDRPGWGAVHSGLFGRRRSFVPLYEAQPDPDGDDRILVPYSREQVEEAPGADPDVQLGRDEEHRLYGHYGLSGDARDDGPDEAMTRSEEELDVSKTPMQPQERVRIKKVLVTDHVTKTVPVRKEEIRLERD